MRAWRVLIVDDDAQHRNQVRQAIERLTHAQATTGFEIELEGDFDRGARRLRQERFDLAILDVRKDAPQVVEDAGVRALRSCRDDTFVPTVFYTAVPGQAESEQTIFVLVVDKKGGIEALTAAIAKLLDTRLIALRRHLDTVQQSLLWDSVPKFLANQGVSGAEACGLLVRSLARQMDSSETRSILGLQEGLRHPVECYVLPAATPHPTTGDLYTYSQDGKPTYWIVLNPACDLVSGGKRKPKIDKVLMAKCDCAIEESAIANWRKKESVGGKTEDRTSAWNNAKFVLDNRAPNQHMIPGFGDTPDLLVDFRGLELVPYDSLSKPPWKRIASLDSPYAEAVNSRFVQFFGRIGVPDIDIEVIKSRLTPTQPGIDHKNRSA